MVSLLATNKMKSKLHICSSTSIPLSLCPSRPLSPSDDDNSELAQLLDQKAYLEELNRKLESVMSLLHHT